MRKSKNYDLIEPFYGKIGIQTLRIGIISVLAMKYILAGASRVNYELFESLANGIVRIVFKKPIRRVIQSLKTRNESMLGLLLAGISR